MESSGKSTHSSPGAHSSWFELVMNRQNYSDLEIIHAALLENELEKHLPASYQLTSSFCENSNRNEEQDLIIAH